jgi:DNA ligase D-like protein (predicted polymerase)
VAKADAEELLSIEGREIRVSHPDKLYFSKQVRLSKLELIRYYLAVAPGALNGTRDRPLVLKRYVNGAEGEAFYQKRAPAQRPAWLRTTTLSFPSGRTAEEIVIDDAAGLAWIVNLGCIELHPHPVRAGDLDHPDELRVDLDPGPGVSWADVRTVALEVKSLLEEMGLRGWPKTSGSRGMHVIVRIAPRWTFDEVRRPHSRSRGQWSGARPLWPARNGGRRNVTGCSSTTTRTRRIVPLVQLIRYVQSLTRGYLRRCNGKRFPTVSRPTIRSSQFRSASLNLAIRTRVSMTRLARSNNCSS